MDSRKIQVSRATRAGFARWRWMCLSLVFACLPVGISTAWAEATVQVEIQTSDGAVVNGRVTLTPRGGGTSYGCTTQNNRCQIGGVPGGLYTARFVPTEGSPTSRSVGVGDSSPVRLVIPYNR